MRQGDSAVGAEAPEAVETPEVAGAGAHETSEILEVESVCGREALDQVNHLWRHAVVEQVLDEARLDAGCLLDGDLTHHADDCVELPAEADRVRALDSTANAHRTGGIVDRLRGRGLHHRVVVGVVAAAALRPCDHRGHDGARQHARLTEAGLDRLGGALTGLRYLDVDGDEVLRAATGVEGDVLDGHEHFLLF